MSLAAYSSETNKKHKHLISDVFTFCVISLMPSGKSTEIPHGIFLELIFVRGTFGGFFGSPGEFFCFDFASIRSSSPPLEIRSTPWGTN